MAVCRGSDMKISRVKFTNKLPSENAVDPLSSSAEEKKSEAKMIDWMSRAFSACLIAHTEIANDCISHSVSESSWTWLSAYRPIPRPKSRKLSLVRSLAAWEIS